MAPFWSLFGVILAGCFYASLAVQPTSSGVSNPVSSPDSLPIGNPRRCLLRHEDQRILTFESLPGGGWDNLRNRDSGLVTAINYTQCRFTEDGRFLIPDGTDIIPIKSSKVDTYAEIFVHWTSYTSTLSHGINANAGLIIDEGIISGGFSDEYRNVKSSQYRDSSATVRVQARYVRYTAKLQPDTPLSKSCKARLMKIAAHHQLNRTALATFESQLFVRDFGTHVITSIDVGAALSQEDQVLSSFVGTSSSERNQVKASAGVFFLDVFNFNIGFSSTTTKAMVDEYQRNRTSSVITTYGGPVFKPTNSTPNSWTADMENNLVAIDRSGDPIYYVITPEALPDVPLSTVYETKKSVKAAVELYYQHNMYHGCTDKESPNFSFISNFDDGSCKPPLTNYTFGGVYQTCDQSGILDPCSNLRQKNPRTGDYTCPPRYEAVLLNEGSRSATASGRECSTCFLIFNCCHEEIYHSKGTYKAYWCVAAAADVPQQYGLLFGGVFTTKVSNPLTQQHSCPVYFIALRLFADLTVCVSDDYELGAQYALPFAGFYSCKSGNPLMVKKSLDKSSDSLPEGTFSLARFMAQAGPTAWPHGCPKGYSQHLALVDNGCEINYCIKSGALTALKLPPVRRPPFMTFPEVIHPDPERESVQFKADGSMWNRVIQNESGIAGHSHTENSSTSSSSSLSNWTVAIIAVIGTLLICLVVYRVLLKTYSSRGKKNQQCDLSNTWPSQEVGLLTNSPDNYGALEGQGDPAGQSQRHPAV